MKIIAAYFDRKNRYTKLLKVFKRSAARIMPDIPVKILNMAQPENISIKMDMSFAFEATGKYCLATNENLAVCDIDLMFVRRIDDVFKMDFDLAVTVRELKYKYNTGIWFFKPTAEAKKFMREWMKNNRYFMNNFDKEILYIGKYAGIDQAALARTIEENTTAKIIELQCLEWNACQGQWARIDKTTRVIHIKSKLRQVAVKGKRPPEGHEYLSAIAEKWRAYLK